jgi:tetratricopeptide (TPR) repeat protein
VLEQDPIHGDSLLALGDLLLRSKPAEARELFSRAARLSAFQIQAWTALARLAVEQGDFARAAALVQRALAKKPDPALERYLAQIRAAMP